MSLITSRRIYTGRVINLDKDTVRYPDGSEGELELFRHPGASAVVPLLDPPEADDPRLVLIRQYRHAAGGFIWEIPAGRLDAKEDPETCARRELEEETGFRARTWRRLTTLFTTPGFTDEQIHFFLATDLEEGSHRRESDEFLEVRILRWTEALRMMETGEVVDGKTFAALSFVQAFVKKR